MSARITLWAMKAISLKLPDRLLELLEKESHARRTTKSLAGAGVPGADAGRASHGRPSQLLRSRPGVGRVGERSAAGTRHQSEMPGKVWPVEEVVLLDRSESMRNVRDLDAVLL